MIELRYNIKIDDSILNNSLKRLTNQIYKLLPQREEGGDWKLSLSTIVEELSGMNQIWLNAPQELFILICKLEGLSLLEAEDGFFLYRRTIFDCLQIISKIISKVGV